jgi:hypothetical protein
MKSCSYDPNPYRSPYPHKVEYMPCSKCKSIRGFDQLPAAFTMEHTVWFGGPDWILTDEELAIQLSLKKE